LEYVLNVINPVTNLKIKIENEKTLRYNFIYCFRDFRNRNELIGTFSNMLTIYRGYLNF